MPSVVNIVGPHGHPAPIPQLEMDAIRRAVESRHAIQPYLFAESGDRMHVTDGPMAAIEAVLVREKSLHCLVLSVELLQKSVAVEIPC